MESGTQPVLEFDCSALTEVKHLASMERDLNKALHSIRQITIFEDDIVKEALFDAALIAYRRCFTSGVRPRLDGFDPDSLGEDGREYHLYLLELASRLVAHSVSNMEDYVAGIVFASDGNIGAAVIHIKASLFGDEEIRSQFEKWLNSILRIYVDPRRQLLLAEARAVAAELTLSQRNELKPIRWTRGSDRQMRGKRRG